MEHIHDHDPFFKECYRILKKDGLLIFSRPNILSLKSRLQFLFTGFYYSFKPLDHHNTDGLQHIASLTVDQYNYLAFINGLEPYRSSFDKRQSTSRLLSFLIPFLWVVSKIKPVHYSIHNRYDLLTARILFYAYKKSSG